MSKSWWEEKYPKHTCQVCDLEHVKIPIFTVEQPIGDGKNQTVQIAPFELLGTVDGPLRPGIGTPLDTPMHVIGLLWGSPGDKRDVKSRSMVCLN